MAENKTEEEILETDTVNEEASSAEEETKEAGNEASAGETEAKEAEEKADKKAEKKEKKAKKKKDKKDEQIEELQDRVRRQMAEFDNFRKRTEKEKAQMFEVGAKSIIEKILPVIDNFERGLASIPEEEAGSAFADGMNMIYKQLMNGVSRIVRRRSRADGSVRVAITAGTVQPKPMSIGTKLRPDRPILRRSLSITKATRAI